MEIDILDGPEKNFKLLIQKLRAAGFSDVYEKKRWLMVRRSESVQVKVRHNGVNYEVKPLFPQIGNFVQAVFTLVLWGLLAYLGVRLNLLIAIILAQGISFGFHYPKIKKLVREVEKVI